MPHLIAPASLHAFSLNHRLAPCVPPAAAQDPARRLDVVTALQHPWVTGKGTAPLPIIQRTPPAPPAAAAAATPTPGSSSATTQPGTAAASPSPTSSAPAQPPSGAAPQPLLRATTLSTGISGLSYPQQAPQPDAAATPTAGAATPSPSPPSHTAAGMQPAPVLLLPPPQQQHGPHGDDGMQEDAHGQALGQGLAGPAAGAALLSPQGSGGAAAGWPGGFTGPPPVPEQPQPFTCQADTQAAALQQHQQPEAVLHPPTQPMEVAGSAGVALPAVGLEQGAAAEGSGAEGQVAGLRYVPQAVAAGQVMSAAELDAAISRALGGTALSELMGESLGLGGRGRRSWALSPPLRAAEEV